PMKSSARYCCIAAGSRCSIADWSPATDSRKATSGSGRAHAATTRASSHTPQPRITPARFPRGLPVPPATSITMRPLYGNRPRESALSVLRIHLPARLASPRSLCSNPYQTVSQYVAHRFSWRDGMTIERPWLAHYPPGVPAEIDVVQYPSIPAMLDESIRQFGQRPAFSNMGKCVSYDELESLSRRFAAYLLGELKLKKGDRVAIMMPNCLQYPIATFGVLRAGLTVVNVNPMYTARELRHQMVDSGASVILVLDNFAHTVQQVLPDSSIEHVITTGLGDMLGFPKGAIVNFVLRNVKKMVPDYDIPSAVRFRDTLDKGAAHELPEVSISPEDIAFLQYTGGTTGVAKGAMLTHRNLVANMQQASAWVGADARPGEEVIITALPLYHIFALTANGLVFTKFGAKNILITNPRDMPGFVKELRREPFTAITGVNTLFNGLLNTPGFDQVDFSKLHLTLGGGMAVQRAVAERWKKVTGVTLVEAYGLTETSPAACINPMDLAEYNGSIGLPIPS